MNQSNNFMENLKAEHKTLQEIAYLAIRDRILAGELKPGDCLNSNELSRSMDISRTPVREAINRLVSAGLAEKATHKEAKVADFLSDQMQEIYYVRSYLEGLAARMSARKMPAEDKQRLLELAQDLLDYGESMTVEEFSQNNNSFHQLLYSSIGTPLLRELIDQLYVLTRRHRMVGYQMTGGSKRVAQEHFRLAYAILEGDETRAERAGIDHHSNTIEQLKHPIDETDSR
jgi:DNA-binding GntR family transcriptional regulator